MTTFKDRSITFTRKPFIRKRSLNNLVKNINLKEKKDVNTF
jgi:hypothetical protein